MAWDPFSLFAGAFRETSESWSDNSVVSPGAEEAKACE